MPMATATTTTNTTTPPTTMKIVRLLLLMIPGVAGAPVVPESAPAGAHPPAGFCT